MPPLAPSCSPPLPAARCQPPSPLPSFPHPPPVLCPFIRCSLRRGHQRRRRTGFQSWRQGHAGVGGQGARDRGQDRGGRRPWSVLGFPGKGRQGGVNMRLAHSSDFSGLWVMGVLSCRTPGWGDPGRGVSPPGAGQVAEAGLAGGLTPITAVPGGPLAGGGYLPSQARFQMSEHHRRQKTTLYMYTYMYNIYILYIQNTALAESSLQRPGPSSSQRNSGGLGLPGIVAGVNLCPQSPAQSLSFSSVSQAPFLPTTLPAPPNMESLTPLLRPQPGAPQL